MRRTSAAVVAALVVAGCTEATRSRGREADGPHPVSAPSPERMAGGRERALAAFATLRVDER